VNDFAVRPYTDADAPSVVDFFNDVDRYAGVYPGFTVSEMNEWSSGWADRDANSRMVIGPEGAPVAFGVVDSPPEGGFRVDAFGAVAPAWRGRGLGTTSANSNDTSALRLFERFGMAIRRRFLTMEAPIASAPPAAPLTGFRVTTADVVDAKALYETHMTAFEDHFGFQRRAFDDWAGSSLGSDEFRADLSRIAYAGEDIVGYVLSFDEATPERVYVGQVGVRRQNRGAGIATALLGEVVAASGAAGKDLVRLEVDADSLTGAVGIYERVGFAVVSEVIAYGTPLPIGA
jgi:ribosomal protein S18 acetylase RimI-like enzyme